MALYLGNDKQKLNLGGITYHLNLTTTSSTINTIKLLSSDGYILKSSNGIYLIVKEAD